MRIRSRGLQSVFGFGAVLTGIWCVFAEDAEPAQALPAAADVKVDFARDIEPLFAKHCYDCHGPDEQESGLRLDVKSGSLGDSGRAVVAGKSAESLLIKYVAGIDAETVMPPDGKVLTDREIGLLRAWIDQGAAWPAGREEAKVADDHWAYQPLATPEIPKGEPASWIRNPIDAFVLARLNAAKIAPSPEADRTTLIRRLNLDLVGLPPTPEEVDEFVNDARPDAYERLVDRLLASEHFGERWGRHWLDLARYADSDGYEKDNPRPDAYKFRDWVIDAVNRDLPFDQFTIEQLAGDLLPDATLDQKIATAFHRQTLTNTEGGTDQEQFRVEATFDRVNTTGSVWLGLTVGCAQCHSHKYDRISQAEYYKLFAFFNNGDETTTRVPKSPAEFEQYEITKKAYDKKVSAHEAKIAARRAVLAETRPTWEADLQARVGTSNDAVAYHPLDVVSAVSENGATLTPQSDGSYLASGTAPETDVYTIVAKLNVPGITGFKVEALADPSLPSQGPGRVAHGNFVLSEVQAAWSATQDFANARELTFTAAEADFSQGGWPVANAIDGKPETGWAIASQFGKNHWAVFGTSAPLKEAGPIWVRLTLRQNYGTQHTVGRFRVTARTGTAPASSLPENVTAILKVAAAERTSKQQEALLDYQFSQDAEGSKLLKEREPLKKQAPAEPYLNVRVIAQRANPRTTHILRRGDFLDPQAPVEPGTLATLHEFDSRKTDGMADRLDFATWLMAPENPLTPRVAANRVWAHLFGKGIVTTVGDFGVRGEKPTHPELLDWLAGEYRRLGWSRKAFIKRIVMSSTYRQSSQHRPELVDVDPTNRLYHRQNRFRIEAELIRDTTLAVSGLLSRKIGGPSVFPPMDADVAALSYANNFRWTTSPGEDRYRRGMYTFFKRTAPHPNLVAFDCPDANTTCLERNSSNTPLQALTTLNNDTFVEAAQAFARRVLSVPANSPEDRIDYAFRLCVARVPTAGERQKVAELLDTSRAWYAQHPAEAKTLAGETIPVSVEMAELAAWVATGRVLLNLDEFVTRE